MEDKSFSQSGVSKGNPSLEAFNLEQRIVWLIWCEGVELFKRFTGHKGDEPKAGIFISLSALFIWMVLDHLRRMEAPRSMKKTSALASCVREIIRRGGVGN